LATVVPDSVVAPLGGQERVVCLPERIHPARGGCRGCGCGWRRRIWRLWGTGAEVFARETAALPQGVEGGDVGEEIGTNQLRALAVFSSAARAFDRPSVFGEKVDQHIPVVSLYLDHAAFDGVTGAAFLFESGGEILEFTELERR